MTDHGWVPSVCILCECNCGIEVKLDGRRIDRVRGDKSHAASAGYTCEKALRIDYYQNGPQRLTSPLRRLPGGTYEEIDWDTAIAEVAAGLSAVRDSFGGETIFYYGGGGQGNHLGGAYSPSLRAAVGSRYRSSGLAQEKTGEFWVNAALSGAGTRGDFEHTEVAVFVGKNPWHSHGIPQARRTLKAIANDQDRSLVVLDVRRTETADLADYFLQVLPGTDAFCLAALLAVVVEENLLDRPFIDANVVGAEVVIAALRAVPIADYAERSGVPEELIRRAARRIATASSVAVFEDLGVQMAPHSTLNSYLDKLLWVLTGNFAIEGGMNVPTALVPFGKANAKSTKVSPVAGERIISGMVPCNVIADEVLTEHPARYRAMIIESANPVHSLADSRRFREAMRALEFSVVIDVAMSETAREASIVLPAASQYEKWEATFFNFEVPANVFSLRNPILEPLAGTLAEPEIHYRLCRAVGAIDDDLVASLRALAVSDRAAFAAAFVAATSSDPLLGRMAPVYLYATLGPSLPEGAAAAAVLWATAHRAAMTYPEAVRRAGHRGEGFELGEALFAAILEGRHGTVFTLSEYEDSWRQVGTEDGKLHVDIPEMLDRLDALGSAPETHTSDAYPFVLSAGERRSFTANTIFRDPDWRKRDRHGALRMSPADAASLGAEDGATVQVSTQRGTVRAVVQVTDTIQTGHISLPNGHGVDFPAADGAAEVTGVAPNDLTWPELRDDFAGTPWHKHVPAAVEVVPG